LKITYSGMRLNAPKRTMMAVGEFPLGKWEEKGPSTHSGEYRVKLCVCV
jgi:hypothetical protein